MSPSPGPGPGAGIKQQWHEELRAFAEHFLVHFTVIPQRGDNLELSRIERERVIIYVLLLPIRSPLPRPIRHRSLNCNYFASTRPIADSEIN